MVNKIYRVKEVCEMTGLPVSTLYAKMLNKEFPRPIKLGRRSVGWRSRDIEQWLKSRKVENF
jgi:prophage regulatory protein